MCPFIDTGGLPGPRNVLAEGNVLGKVRQFEWGQKKKVLENQTMAFTQHGRKQINSVFNHSSSRIKIVPKNEFSSRMQDEQEG